MRSALVAVLLGACATGGGVRIAEGMDVAAYVSDEDGARHAHPASVSEAQVRAALLKDGNLVDAQIGSVAGACASELGRMRPGQRIVIKSGAVLALFVDADAVVVGRIESGAVTAQTRYSIAAQRAPEMLVLPSTTAGDAPRVKARGLYDEAMSHYNLGEVREALEAFKSAYRLVPEASLLFNIAQCHRRLGQAAQALEMYRAYRREAPDAPNRAAVERFIQELEHR